MGNPDVGTHLADLAGISAESLIKKLGSFGPFGLAINAERQRVLVSKSDDGQSLLTLETVPLQLRAAAAKERLLATAVVAFLPIASSANAPAHDTIVIQIEVPGADVVVMGRTVKKGLFGYKFGEPFVIAQPIAERVFA